MLARDKDRIRSLLRARAIFNNGGSTIDCVIKNFSDDGARLEIGDVVALPAEFDLSVPHKGRTFRANIIWRDANSVGVEFARRAVREVTEDDALTKTMRENVHLKAMVRELSARLEALGQDVPVRAAPGHD